RLALLREPHPPRAARAVAAAFAQLDWHTAQLDEHLEARLVAALPPMPGPLRSTLSWLRAPRHRVPLPRAFVHLPAKTRLALGLRLLRGYTCDAIATVLKLPPDEVRGLLYDALTTLSRQHSPQAASECRASRMLRLDTTQAAQTHLVSCASCRDATIRSDEVEKSLRDALLRATSTISLPRTEVAAIAETLQRSLGQRKPATHHAWFVGGVVGVVVILVLALVGTTRRQQPPLASKVASPRTLVAQALEHYGAVPEGDGIVHERYLFEFGEGGRRLEAETWTDTARPARHRMQLIEGTSVREWQSGDGGRSLQYINTIEDDTCGPNHPSTRLGARSVNRWAADDQIQATL
ncbi:MAG: hypothetical protein AVDCRST_MAG93-1956, partial [uncultured Chloroflexia bacterium]